MQITTLGPKATYTHQGAKKHFKNAHIKFVESISELFDQKNTIIFPLENSIEGTVRQSFDGLFEKKLYLSATFRLPINHCLSSEAKKLKDIKAVLSHPQAVSQCRKFLNKHLKHAKIKYVQSTAEAVKKAKKSPTSAAIASKYACENYNLKILKKNIEDEKNNVTIFGVANKTDIFPKRKKEEMHIFITPKKNKPGLLFNILKPFHDLKIDLTRLESRPTRKKIGNYKFLLSFKIKSEKNIKKALNILRKNYKIDVLGKTINL